MAACLLFIHFIMNNLPLFSYFNPLLTSYPAGPTSFLILCSYSLPDLYHSNPSHFFKPYLFSENPLSAYLNSFILSLPPLSHPTFTLFILLTLTPPYTAFLKPLL